jgi:hypothetical protein
MKKIVRLTESDLNRIVSRVINENKIYNYIEPFIESECVITKNVGDYLVIDVQSPGYFEEFGFDRGEGIKIKNMLRKEGFMSTGVGEYMKKVR